MACDRFTQDESWLAKEVKQTGRPYLFVRSKVDAQIDSDAIRKRKAMKPHNPLTVIDEIREDCKQNLGQEKNIYLINNNDIFLQTWISTSCSFIWLTDFRNLRVRLSYIRFIFLHQKYYSEKSIRSVSE
jgi:hypothetical protein